MALRALDKWRESKLARRPAGENYRADAEHFTFTYDGSTCCNGGTPFRAHLHAVVVRPEGAGSAVVESAWIEIPSEERDAASMMCASPGAGAEAARPFFVKLEEPAEFCGRTLEDIIAEEVPENFAGCFCGRPHINQKWKIALSTIHLALFAE